MSPAPLHEEIRAEQRPASACTIAEAFLRQVAESPERIAVVAGDRRLSYRELDERSDCVAAHLQSLGVEPETLVGVAVERSEALVVGLLGILKSGGAYVPLDPHYPTERLEWIIEDSKMSVVLTTAKIRERLPQDRIKMLELEKSDGDFASKLIAASNCGRENLAYVMYTSGSTGKPKGVMVENGNVLSFFDGMDEVIGREPGVWLAVTSVCFDISVLELLWTLSRGFTVVLHDDAGSNPIGDEIASHGVTHLQMTPSLARMLELDPRTFAELGCLKKLLLGGEAVPSSLIHRVRRVYAGEIYNMYGPTETTIWSTAGRVGEVGKSVPIGRPIAGTEVSLLDTELKPIPAGEVGELFIGGAGVTRGYWNRPDLTAERFVTVPMISSKRMYRTGDLGRLLPDGSIEFLGRADYQVKLRGHRIEPGEIEAVLERCCGVRQAVVVLREDREGDKRLVAYLVGEPSQSPGAEGLRSVLKSTVPDYMVPSFFVFLAELPLTQNKKIDRKALLAMPAPDAGARDDVRLECEPSSEMERIVARAWQEALGLSCVGLDDNFFDLGAHSLTVAEVHASLQATLSREMPLVDLFQFSTVRALAAHLAGVESIAIRNELSERAQRRRLARHS